jgi:putative acetyltransferase
VAAVDDEFYASELRTAWAELMRGIAVGERIARCHFLVAERVGIGAVVGFVAVRMSEPALAELEMIYVDPTVGGQGCGGQLMRAALAWAESQGAMKIHLIGSLNAQGFYRRHGFELDYAEDREVQGIRYPIVQMSRSI